MGSREADALDAIESRDRANEIGEVGGRFVRARAFVRIDVLAEQRHFAHALPRERCDLRHHLRERAAHFFAARIGHDAERTELAAAFHDGNERGRAVRARLGQAVELLDLWKADVNHRTPRLAEFREHFGQSMQRLRSEHEIHERCALGDARAFLACDAAANTDDHAGTLLFQLAPLAQQREHLLLRLLTHGTGIDEEQIGSCGVIGRFVAAGSAQDIGESRRVVFVHLTAEGADIEVAGHAPLGAPSRGAYVTVFRPEHEAKRTPTLRKSLAGQ